MQRAQAHTQAKPLPAASFGELLFQIRQRAGMSQRQLGRLTGLSNSAISEFENCRRPPPARDHIVVIARALRATDAQLASMVELAGAGRRVVGKLRLGKETRPEVALLLRDVFQVATRLDGRQVAALRVRLLEVAM